MIQRSPLVCRFCGSAGLQVTDTRSYTSYIRRRRKCKTCGKRITTYEIESTYVARAAGGVKGTLQAIAEHMEKVRGLVEAYYDGD